MSTTMPHILRRATTAANRKNVCPLPPGHGLNDEAFQILSFREAENNRMVCWLSNPPDKPRVTLGILHPFSDRTFKLMGSNMVRAGEGYQQPAFGKQSPSALMEVAIPAQRLVHSGPGFCK